MITIENQPLVTVHLYGDLAELYGPEHHLAISSPREAVMLLDVNYPGFARKFIEHERYIVIGDGTVRDGEMAALNVAEEVHFIPMVEGKAFLGAALFTWLGFGALASQILGTLLFLGIMIGIAFLLKPKQPEKKETEEKKDDSFAFSGPENVTGQGVAVPLIYGRVWAGTVVVSAGLDVTDVPIT